MKAYFQLQLKIINRRIIDFGLPLFLGYTIIPLLFFLLSDYLFQNLQFAVYVYMFVAISFALKWSEPKRNQFLKAIYSKSRYRNLRILENLVYGLPFSAFLIYKQQFVLVAVLNMLLVLLAQIHFNTNLNLPIPTPFGKKPFEFTVGFRKTWFVFPVAYFLTYISVAVGNFNLGIFAIILVGVTCLSYYSKIENEYFVWNYSVTPKDFLLEKAKTALLNFSLLSLPIIVVLGVLFFNQISILAIFVVLAYAYLIVVVFAKYAAYPNEMSMSQGILIGTSFLLPPILLLLIPYFYNQSIKKLNTVLND